MRLDTSSGEMVIVSEGGVDVTVADDTILPLPFATRLESKLDASSGDSVCVSEGRVTVPDSGMTTVTVTVGEAEGVEVGSEAEIELECSCSFVRVCIFDVAVVIEDVTGAVELETVDEEVAVAVNDVIDDVVDSGTANEEVEVEFEPESSVEFEATATPPVAPVASMTEAALFLLVQVMNVPVRLSAGRTKHDCVAGHSSVSHPLVEHAAGFPEMHASSPIEHGSLSLSVANWALSACAA